MKKKTIRILSIAAIMVLALSVATTAFAATVNTTTQYIVGTDANKISVTTNISNATPESSVAYLVTAGDNNPTPTNSNVLYLNQYEVDQSGAATIEYKIDTTSTNFPSDFKTSVRFGSTASDTFSDSLSEIEYYRVNYNANGTVSVLPIEGYEITSVTVDGNAVSTLALTYDANSSIKATTQAIASSSNVVGDDAIAAAKKTVDSTAQTVNYLFQPVSGVTGITEIGIKYGQLLFPSKAGSIGITNVKLDFSGVTTPGFVFADEAAKCRPYYIDGDGLHYYNYNSNGFVDGTLE